MCAAAAAVLQVVDKVKEEGPKKSECRKHAALSTLRYSCDSRLSATAADMPEHLHSSSEQPVGRSGGAQLC